MKLYTYFRSSAAYRVRIALALKGLQPVMIPVHLLRDGGEQSSPEYLALNRQGLIPALDDDGTLVTQSMAICEYLEEIQPIPALLPADPAARARVRALALAIACEIHPLNNLRVLNYLTGTLGLSEAQKLAWYHHWIRLGFSALEAQLAAESTSGKFCHGDAPTLADVFLVPQVANARRFDLDLSAFPTLLRIDANCRELPAFIAAAPQNQADAV
ncbi:MAG: maleylacetoacetate isomerase [Rhodocyclaceae bacterium]|nr:maleylacetoacetate isomerase [Rhodocyclaceae bacterium]MBK9625337.1 maleylacetoacetate isomerase [Rhodocyclaceae bacterium]MBP6109624.1 maleylacetoacetate isomerase [Rhodocyclaceae bacterium]MBP6278904.1 maleylacetoacetate isomerase [Rhodocyclaceae bacterium]